jgi:hypothetical protein
MDPNTDKSDEPLVDVIDSQTDEVLDHPVYVLSEEFLSGPAPNPEMKRIDFKKEGLPEYADCYAVIIDNILTPTECEQFVAAAESHASGQWERAMINVGAGKQVMYVESRKCGRIIWDSPEIAAKVWARVAPLVPEVEKLVNWPKVTGGGPAKRREVWRATRCNERMRVLKYGAGEYFKRTSFFLIHLLP